MADSNECSASPLIIYEGVDGAGKSSLRAAFARLTLEKYCTVDRLFPSCWVYDTMRGNFQRRVTWVDKMRRLIAAMPVIIVHVEPNIQFAAKIRDLDPVVLGKTNQLFWQFYDRMKIKPMVITNWPSLHPETSILELACALKEKIEGV